MKYSYFKNIFAKEMKKFSGSAAPNTQPSYGYGGNVTPMYQAQQPVAPPPTITMTQVVQMASANESDPSVFAQAEWNVLISLKWNDGTIVASVDTPDGRGLLYHLYCIITMPSNKNRLIKDSNGTLEKNAQRLIEAFAKLPPSAGVGARAILNTFVYDPETFIYLSEIDQLRSVNNIAEGEQCPRCGGYKTITYYIQDRSGDEGESRRFKCLMCPEGNKT
jgi:DNA-directed RNA polymerase subunit M/transcription elongation factor TFIIS